MTFCKRLPDAAIEQHVAQSHSLWGDGHAIERRVAALRARLAAAGPDRFWMSGLMTEGGGLTVSLKCYALELKLGARRLGCLGIGAVFTDPAHRGRGLAADLIGRVREHFRAERGYSSALLFSDIGTGLYGRLGFELVEECSRDRLVAASDLAATETRRLETRPLEAGDGEAALALFRRATDGCGLRLERTPASWAMFREVNRIKTDYALIDGAGRLAGVLAVSRGSAGRELVVEELLVWPGELVSAAWDVVRRLAHEEQASMIRGWDGPLVAWPASSTAVVRKGELPMLAFDDEADRASFASLKPTAYLAHTDHF